MSPPACLHLPTPACLPTPARSLPYLPPGYQLAYTFPFTQLRHGVFRECTVPINQHTSKGQRALLFMNTNTKRDQRYTQGNTQRDKKYSLFEKVDNKPQTQPLTQCQLGSQPGSPKAHSLAVRRLTLSLRQASISSPSDDAPHTVLVESHSVTEG